jgi:hypothetical protein
MVTVFALEIEMGGILCLEQLRKVFAGQLLCHTVLP